MSVDSEISVNLPCTACSFHEKSTTTHTTEHSPESTPIISEIRNLRAEAEQRNKIPLITDKRENHTFKPKRILDWEAGQLNYDDVTLKEPRDFIIKDRLAKATKPEQWDAIDSSFDSLFVADLLIQALMQTTHHNIWNCSRTVSTKQPVILLEHQTL